MPKSKSRSAVTKRFSINKNGVIKYKQAGNNHKADKKDKKRKRNLRRTGYTSKSDIKNVKTMLGV